MQVVQLIDPVVNVTRLAEDLQKFQITNSVGGYPGVQIVYIVAVPKSLRLIQEIYSR